MSKFRQADAEEKKKVQGIVDGDFWMPILATDPKASSLSFSFSVFLARTAYHHHHHITLHYITGIASTTTSSGTVSLTHLAPPPYRRGTSSNTPRPSRAAFSVARAVSALPSFLQQIFPQIPVREFWAEDVNGNFACAVLNWEENSQIDIVGADVL